MKLQLLLMSLFFVAMSSNVDAQSIKKETKSFVCPMHCEKGKIYTEKGTCPKCKMDLEEVKYNYVCPMHCEGEKSYPEKRECPECLMPLLKHKIRHKR